MSIRTVSRLAAVVAGLMVTCTAAPFAGVVASGKSRMDEGDWRRSLALCADDFDEDGVRDVVVGFERGEGGGLILLRGNVDSIYQDTLEARGRRADGSAVAAPFLPERRVADTADAPELLVAGDFDNDGHRDVAYASRGANALTIASGNGRGGFPLSLVVALPGALRTLSTGELGRADGLVELFVEVDTMDNGTNSLVLEDTLGAARAIPRALEASAAIRKHETSTAELRMRLNSDGVDDLVILRPDVRIPSFRLTEPRATFSVTTTNDAGTGSLRAAIEAANASQSDDAISFNISGSGPHTIVLASPLPAVSPDGGALAIDATTEPDYSNAPVVVLDGSNLEAGENGLVIFSANCTVRGLVIQGLRSNTNSGGGQAIALVEGGGCRVEGNFLGTNAAGTAATGNAAGVSIQNSAGNVVGGTVAAARNVISGNESVGVTVNYEATATANVISGNFIGTNAAGSAAIPNGTGVYLSDAPGNTVGGLAPGSRNVIAGSMNPGFGIGIAYEAANGNLVQGNFVGIAADGISALGNGSTGVFVGGGASDNVIGGPATGAANRIAHNLTGVEILEETSLPGVSRGNLVSRNSIHSNDRLGINLSLDYDGDPAPNDDGDDDDGPNGFQNYPVITSVTGNRVRGSLDSVANSTYTIDFYSNDACDLPTGFGEGKTWLGAAAVTTNGSGHADIDEAMPVGAGVGISTTATDANGNTSEFSQCFAVGGSSVADLSVSAGADVSAVAAGRSFNYYLTVRNNGPGTATGITLTNPLPQQTTFVEINPVAGWSVTTPTVGSGGSVVATTSSLTAGAEVTFVLTVRVRDDASSGELVSTATVTSSMDPASSNDTTTAVTQLNGADASVDLSVTMRAGPEPVQPLSRIVYTITVANAGPADATDTRLIVDAPAGTHFVTAAPAPATAPAVGESGSITWDLRSFRDGRSDPFFVVVSLPGGITPGAGLSATASVTNSTRDSDSSDDEASAATTVASDQTQSDLAVTASASATSVQAGDPLTYTVRVTNGGPGSATNVMLFNALPNGAYFVSATTTQGTLVTPQAFDSSAVVASVGSLASGASATVTIAMTVTSGGGSIVSRPFSLASTLDPNPENSVATVTTTVRSAGVAIITWEPPDLESLEAEPPPRNLVADLDSLRTTFAAPARVVPSLRFAPRPSGARRADPPSHYNIYTSNVPGVGPNQSNFFTSVPATTTTTTAPVAPGGSFFVVTAGYPTGESSPTNEDGAGELDGPDVMSVVVTAKKITVKGTGFGAPMQVFVDGIPFVTPAKVKGTKVNQKGRLLTGQTLGEYARAGQTVEVTVRGANGGTTTTSALRR